MREILFRGKTDDGKWKHGSLTLARKEERIGAVIVDVEDSIVYGVIPETVGQYTGLKDKNGKMIFEGDVVRIEDFVNATVKWREDIACWTLQSYIIGNTWGSSMLEVIGNIHDQKEDV